MSIRGATQKEHDQVVQAAALTYEHLKQSGYMVSTNPDGQQNHNIGNGIFPDVVVWKTNSEFGHTLIIEEVETTETISDHEALEWKRYARFGAKFSLIVPKDLVKATREIVQRHHIDVDQIEGYWIEKGDVKFVTRE